MRYKPVAVLLLTLILLGCTTGMPTTYAWKHPLSIPAADVLYQTVKHNPTADGRDIDVFGLYDRDTNTIYAVNLGIWLLTPHSLGEGLYAAIRKNGNPANINDFGGSAFIFSEEAKLECEPPYAVGWWIHPYQGNVLIASDTGINLIDRDDCSLIRTLLTEEQFLLLSGGKHIGPYSVSGNGGFLVIDSGGQLVKMDLKDMSLFEYGIAGTNPSISPDQQFIAYEGSDGIHIMDVTGENDRLISALPGGLDYLMNGILPRPNWSRDGKELVYHKCRNITVPTYCLNFNDYSIYIYSLEDQTEMAILSDGINPSFR